MDSMLSPEHSYGHLEVSMVFALKIEKKKFMSGTPGLIYKSANNN